MAKAKGEFMIYDSSRICPVCMREFCTPDPETWAYKTWSMENKRVRTYFCSWGCLRKYENGATISGRGMKLSTKKRRIWQALDDGLSVKEIAILLDITPKSVSYYKSKWIPKGENANEEYR